MKLNFAKANAKLARLEKFTGLKVYSFSLLAGHSCPYAKICHSRAIDVDGKRHIEDGADTLFRCYAASNEVMYPSVFKAHNENMGILKLSTEDATKAILDNIPNKAELVRVHPSGDFKTLRYFDAWMNAARELETVLFYAYTKSTPFLVKRRNTIPPNFVFTSSIGGHRDDLIKSENLRYAIVVDTEQDAAKLGLPVDHDDTIAALQPWQSFALVLHGTQPAGTDRAKIWNRDKAETGYNKWKTYSPTDAFSGRLIEPNTTDSMG